MKFTFVTSCISANGDDINEMKDMPLCTDISTSNFINRIALKIGIDSEVLDSLGYQTKKEFAKDWAVSVHKSYYQGIPCYFVKHSAIEYVWIDNKNISKVLTQQASKDRQAALYDHMNALDYLLHDRKPVGLKELNSIVREYFVSNRESLSSNRIPLSSLAQYQCPYREIAASLDRKLFGKVVPNEPTYLR